ncbi:3150_t:CDS:2 [Ambispora gerdemannii]|uniref:3150_t:CDS:1 n=1 Tax=Ambispora gerdemannii TaxID=144530 RepID=A0A9N9B4C2_9GLOM|nr:3150_t:CDS:2 [Ambispora gerdemannii]
MPNKKGKQPVTSRNQSKRLRIKKTKHQEQQQVLSQLTNRFEKMSMDDVQKEEVLKDNVQNYEVFPSTVDELKVALKEEWEKLDVFVFVEVIASIPRRINAVLKANGKPTKYLMYKLLGVK